MESCTRQQTATPSQSAQSRVLQVSGSDNVHEAFEKFRLLEEAAECGQSTIGRRHAHAQRRSCTGSDRGAVRGLQARRTLKSRGLLVNASP